MPLRESRNYWRNLDALDLEGAECGNIPRAVRINTARAKAAALKGPLYLWDRSSWNFSTR